MRVLITAGGTEEPIDGVRSITNFSTGNTGAFIANKLEEKGIDVTLLTSVRGTSPDPNVKTLRYKTFFDLESIIKKELATGYQSVIHLAAVSDFSVNYLEIDGKKHEPNENIKIDSKSKVNIVLKNNHKILNNIKNYSISPLRVIGFKLTKGATPKEVKDKINKLFNLGNVDYIVHNDMDNISKNEHKTEIYTTKGIVLRGKTKDDLVNNLLEII